MRRTLALLLGLAFTVALLEYALREPRLDRDWAPDVRVLARVAIEPDASGFSIEDVRDWRYSSAGPVETGYFDAKYALDDLRETLFYEQILDDRGLIAHTFVVFRFGGDYRHPNLGVSVETRRESGETYSLLKGALRGFELTHTWASERDLVERRVRYLNYRLTQYRVSRPLQEQRRYLLAFLEQTEALSRQPRWYNTITSNCTNVIISAANALHSGALSFDKAYVLTGLADDYLIENGVLETPPVQIIETSTLDAFLAQAHPAGEILRALAE